MRIDIWARSLAAGMFALGLITSAAAQQPPSAPAKPVAAPPAAKANTSAPAAEPGKGTKPVSPCKDLEQKLCAAKAECIWVAATKRKDGRQVKAYCRLQPKSVAKAPALKPAAAAAVPAKK
ncbi:MAG: hypothetical protein KJZ80_16480 [Hyphomicrobiaceae bacterium]|nr:hypothetical protein [Hyphomicrobiaceae bacterium]